MLHVVELLDTLIQSGKLAAERTIEGAITYHDACYLGRYNGIYDAPRRIIEAAGCRLVEMPRHGAQALCCSAGGGRIWMEEGQVTKRLLVRGKSKAILRIEALSAPREIVVNDGSVPESNMRNNVYRIVEPAKRN